MPEKYDNAEQATLFALMLARRPVGNPDLRKDYKIDLRKPSRERLNDDGLIKTWKADRRMVHQIEDAGVTWCAENLGLVQAPPNGGPLGRMVFELMRNLPRYLEWRGVDFVDVIKRGSLESAIRAAYEELSVKSQDWVRLARIRPALEGVDRKEVDALLMKLIKEERAHLAPDSDRKALTADDHAAAIRLGSEDKHLLAIAEPS